MAKSGERYDGMDYWQSIENLDETHAQSTPKLLPEIDPNTQEDNALALAGREFIYTSNAVGLSLDAQHKIVELVDGRGLVQRASDGRGFIGGRRVKWTTVGSLVADLNETRRAHDNFIGATVADEIRAKLAST